jgi:transcription elongation factor S-II
MAEIRRIIVDRIQECSKLTPVHANDVEIGIYNWTIGYAKEHNIMRSWSDKTFKNCYTNKARSVVLNIDGASYVANTRLGERLLNEEFKPYDLACMPSENVCPEAWQKYVEALAVKEEKALKPQIVAKTNRFWCGKCKKNECSFYEMQIRSGDEATTIFVFCLNCGNKWRING